MLVEQFGLRSKLEAGYRQALVNLRDALAAVAPAASAG
jgi:hypothetical protein